MIRRALASDAAVVHRLLLEAAAWVDAFGHSAPEELPDKSERTRHTEAPQGRRRMWDDGELEFDAVEREVMNGEFFVADVNGTIAGAIRFQTEDPLFWPDLPPGDSAFVHRLVVSRAFKGAGVSTALLDWAVTYARNLGRSWLRLDCDNDRPKLKALYEEFGFRFHSHRQVGPYYVARYEYLL